MKAMGIDKVAIQFYAIGLQATAVAESMQPSQMHKCHQTSQAPIAF